MKIIIALILLLNSFGSIALATEQSRQIARHMRSPVRAPASAPQCETPSQLMSSNIVGKDFSNICNKLVAQDEGCKKLKPEKRMNCSTKSANNILSSNDLASKIGQCVKGFVWDSMVDLVKFVLELIKMLVGAQVNSVVGMVKFLGDSDYRAKTLAAAEKGAGTSLRFAKAFLNSTALYFAREYPKNLQKNYYNPVAALGETLAKPLVNFITDSVQKIAAYYIPQYQCMNGVSKLYTICRVMGDFIMPPAFLFTFMKHGINGLRALKAGVGAMRVARVEKRFKEANEIREVVTKAKSVGGGSAKVSSSSRITVDHAPRSPARIRNASPEVASVPHPPKPKPAAPLTKPIEEHSADELIEVARSEQAEARAIAEVPPAAPAKAADEVVSAEEQAARLANDSAAEDLIAAGSKDSPALIVKYSEDPEYSALFKAEKAYPDQSRDIAIVIADMEKKNPQMPKSEIRQEIEKFLNICEVKR